MHSRLKETIRNLSVKKGIKMTSFQENRVRDIERKLDNSEISIEDATGMLESEFGYHFDKPDYQEIKRKLEGR